MTTPQKPFTRTQQHSLSMLCAAIRQIEELAPLEQKRVSMPRKKKMENAHWSLVHYADRWQITIPALSTMYEPDEYLTHTHLVAEALAKRLAPDWKCCEKTTPTRARSLTQTDYEVRHGLIETREGPAPFAVGDYLAVDDLGEYPIRRAALEQHYVQIAPPDEQGWASYRSTEVREARWQFRAFPTDCGATGLAGDYLMRGEDGRTWPCSKEKFEQEYRFVENIALDELLTLKVTTPKPLTYCLCGSTGRATHAFQAESLRLTLAGHKVLSISVNAKDSDLEITDEQKVQLDILHLFKIEDADVVRILNVGGYIGVSTRRELEYARRLGKRIEFLEDTIHE